MLATIKKYVRNPEDQEDILQESVVKLMGKMGSFMEQVMEYT